MLMPLVLTNRRRRGGGASAPAFSPADIFSSGSQGVWYDPSDLTTMFVDRAGTTPVTAPGTVVGLRLDKSKGGVGTNGASRRNNLTFSEQFNNAIWVKTGISAFGSGSVVDTTATLDPVGGNTADFLREDTSTGAHGPAQTFTSATVTYTSSVYVKWPSGVTRNILIAPIGASAAGNNRGVIFSPSGAFVAFSGATGADPTYNAESIGNNGWWRFSVTGAATGVSAAAAMVVRLASGASTSYTGDNTSGVYIWGAQLELASTASAYQKITSDWPSTMAGNHATAPTDAARPTYGVEPKGGRRNLLTWTEGFDNAVWNKPNLVISPNTGDTSDPFGGSTADKTTPTSGTNVSAVMQPTTLSGPTGSVVWSIYAKQGTHPYIQLAVTNDVAWYANFDISNGSVGTTGSGTASITPVGTNGWYRCTLAFTSSNTNEMGSIWLVPSASATRGQQLPSPSGTESILLWGAQLELGSTATAYQRVLSAYDVTESGVATCHYVQYDGSDDSMSTSAIDFTATDKMSVFAGVRKLSDAAAGFLMELSADLGANSGSFGAWAPFSTTVEYAVQSRGTASSTSAQRRAIDNAAFVSPVSNVLTGLFDISGDTTSARLNGASQGAATADQGTGNYGNYPLFIGRRNNASLPFNGRDYGLIVVGKAASAGEITDTETWLAARTAQVTL